MQLESKKVLVIGLGISGKSAIEFLLRKKAFVTAVDSDKNKLKNDDLQKKGVSLFNDDEIKNIKDFDLVIISPGISPTHFLYKKAQDENIEVIGEIELACRFIKGLFLAITGTNGKTTVTLLTEHILKCAGIKAKALGNMGTPLTSEITDENEVYVVELSSYQLETMRSKVIDAGVILNITPDHLDRYGNMKEYAKAKIHMKNCLKAQNCLYVEENCYQEFSDLFEGFKPDLYGYKPTSSLFSDLTHLIYQQKIEGVLPLALQKKKSHDVENMMASFLLCKTLNITLNQFVEGFKSFKKPSHRIEFVKNFKGVSYFDDSKGTNIDAVVRAVDSIEGEVILIAGGVDKGASYTPWIKAFNKKVVFVCAIGQAKEKIKRDLEDKIPVKFFENLEEATVFASKKAQPGQNVLLSPGCSSFDMFKDYAHRGKEFQRVVNQLYGE